MAPDPLPRYSAAPVPDAWLIILSTPVDPASQCQSLAPPAFVIPASPGRWTYHTCDFQMDHNINRIRYRVS